MIVADLASADAVDGAKRGWIGYAIALVVAV
jgi:hypothetical protein